MKLRIGRKVARHVYLQLGTEPSDDDIPLFTVSADVAQWLVAAVEYAEAHEESGPDDTRERAATAAYRKARAAVLR